MKEYIRAFDHSTKLWTLSSIEGDTIKTMKTAKSAKEIQTFINKKPRIKEEVISYNKNEYYFDGIVEEARQQRKIERVLKKDKLEYDEFLKAENLASEYNYKKDELERKKKEFDVKQEPTHLKWISEVGYFASTRYSGVVSISQKNAERIATIGKTLKGYTKVEFTFTLDDGNEIKTIIDKADMTNDEERLKRVLGKVMRENIDDENLYRGYGKFSFRGLI